MQRHLTWTERVQAVREEVLAAFELTDSAAAPLEVVVEVRQRWPGASTWPGVGVSVLDSTGGVVATRFLAVVPSDLPERLARWLGDR